VDGFIDGTKVRVLLDTGASVNVVSSQHFLKKGEKLTPTSKILTTAGGKQLDVLGVKEVHLQLGGNVGRIKVYVVRGLVQQCILGVEGLQALDICLSFGNKEEALVGKQKLEVSEVSVDTGDLTAQQKCELKGLIEEFSDLFEKVVPGSAKGVEHEIHLETSDPVLKKMYRMPLVRQEIVKQNVDKMLNEGVIRESSSPYSAPVVLVTKKDGTQRFCVDYRELNKVTKKDKFPLPRIDDLLDRVKDSKIFSSLDLASGYWQVKMKEEDKEKTAFATPQGHYEFNVMPFGLTNAPATFQRLMNKVAGRISSVLVYIDDLLIFSKSWKEHMKTLRIIFQTLREFGLKLNAKKCRFGCEEVTFLGFILDAKGCRPDEKKIKPIQNFPTPNDQTELRRFLGFANYYRKFIKNFATTAAPLYELTGKGTPWVWTWKQDLAFLALKDKLMTADVLAVPDISLPFKLYTDASGTGMGAVLMQDQGDGERVIGYASQHFTKREKNYSTIEKEAAAVLWACKEFSPYLVGGRFKIMSDHAPLQWLFGKQGSTGRIGRWQAQLLEFEGLEDIEYLKGTQNEPADALSRVPEVLEIVGSTCEFKLKQECDEKFDEYRSKLNLDHVWKHKGRIFIPNDMRNSVLEQYHGKGVHFGIRRTSDLIKPHFFWPKMDQDISNFVKDCDFCSRAKWSESTASTPFQSMPATERPFKRICIDYAGPFKQSARGNTYFLTIVDDFSRFLKLFPVRDCTAATTIRCLQDLFANEGLPEEIMSDNGTHFTSNSMVMFLQENNIKHIKTAPYHPSANGMAERSVRTVKNLIRSDILERLGTDGSWDSNLLKIQAAYNSTPHSITGQSPFSLARGRTCTPSWCPVPTKVVQTKIPWIIVKNKTQEKRNRDSAASNRKGCILRNFQPGDEVWRRKGNGWEKVNIVRKLHFRTYEVTGGCTVHESFLLPCSVKK